MIGVDIIKVKRFRLLKKNDFSSWTHAYNKTEWEYAFTKSDPHVTLAGLFASKEAVFKALRTGNLQFAIELITIHHSKNGAPYAKVKGSNKNIAISISHDAGFVIAVAIVK